MRPTLYVFGTKTLNAEFEFSYFRIEYLCKIQFFFICIFPTLFCPVNPRYKLKEKRLILIDRLGVNPMKTFCHEKTNNVLNFKIRLNFEVSIWFLK